MAQPLDCTLLSRVSCFVRDVEGLGIGFRHQDLVERLIDHARPAANCLNQLAERLSDVPDVSKVDVHFGFDDMGPGATGGAQAASAGVTWSVAGVRGRRGAARRVRLGAAGGRGLGGAARLACAAARLHWCAARLGRRWARRQRDAGRLKRAAAQVQRDAAQVQRAAARLSLDAARVEREAARLERGAARVDHAGAPVTDAAAGRRRPWVCTVCAAWDGPSRGA